MSGHTDADLARNGVIDISMAVARQYLVIDVKPSMTTIGQFDPIVLAELGHASQE